jgi:indolepyruvate ferredoxin oxidoreductase beta subunit
VTLDLVVAGVGGQGVVTLASVLTRAAVREGYDAHFTAHSGLAQVGSPVLAHVRIGTPAGPSPKVPRGTAHFVVGLERLEGMKLAGYLAPGGQALLSEEAVRPYEARFRRNRYPTVDQAGAVFREKRTLWVPAAELARRHGPPALVSAVMLGTLAGVSRVVERDQLVLSLREAMPAVADAEAEAFFEGYRYVTGKDA